MQVIMEERMLDKATRDEKHPQMLSNNTSKNYENMKREGEGRSGW